MPEFECGEVVRMISDIAEAYQLQQGHGEWNDDMALVGDLVCLVCVLYVFCVLIFLSLLPNSNTSSALSTCMSKLMFITGRL